MGLDLLKEISLEGGKGTPEKNEEDAQWWAVAQAQMMALVIMKTQAGWSSKGGNPAAIWRNLHKSLMKLTLLASFYEWGTKVQSLQVRELELESRPVWFHNNPASSWFLGQACWVVDLCSRYSFLSKSRRLFCYLHLGVLRPHRQTISPALWDHSDSCWFVLK